MATVKKYLVTTDDTQTLSNKTIKLNDSPSSGNSITGIDVQNLATQKTDGTDTGKIWKVKANGQWELGLITQYKLVHTFYDSTGTLIQGNADTLYYLDTAITTPTARATGLYVYNGSATPADYVPCSIGGNVLTDNVSVGYNSSSQLEVPNGHDSTGTGDPSKGLTLIKFRPSVIRDSTEGIRDFANASDDCIATEKAIAAKTDDRIPYNTSETGTDKTFNIGWDANGIFVLKVTP